jgi:hypothetical protein
MEDETQTNQGDYLSASSVLRILWRRKALIIFGTLGMTILSIVISVLLPRIYKSHAVISFATGNTEAALSRGLEIPVYNKYSNTIKSVGLLKKFLDFKQYKEEWDISPNYIEKNITPVYGYDKKERIKSTENFILGLKVSASGLTPKIARERCQLLGDFVRTAILNLKIGDYLEKARVRQEANIIENKRRIAATQQHISDLKEKEELIKSQLLKIPGINPNRELVNVNDQTAKYLSPQHQLVAVKVEIKDRELAIRRFHREIKSSEIFLGYMASIAGHIGSRREYLVNESLLKELLREKEKYFAGKSGEGILEAFYRLTKSLARFNRMDSVVYKFISGPSLPQGASSPPRKLIVAFTFILTFLALIFISFILEWWSLHKNELLGKK